MTTAKKIATVAELQDLFERANVAIVTDYIRTSRITLPIRGGVLGNRMLQTQEIATLATLPARDVLLARFMGGLNGPIAGLVTVLNALIAGFVRVLDARVKQMSESEA